MITRDPAPLGNSAHPRAQRLVIRAGRIRGLSVVGKSVGDAVELATKLLDGFGRIVVLAHRVRV